MPATPVERSASSKAYELHVAQKNPDWPTLIFATSVEHAQTVAALLNTKGVKARSVSGNTDRAVRRGVVDDFRAGKINVLVNYGVFREGFDAPKTRAIVVAPTRPTVPTCTFR